MSMVGSSVKGAADGSHALRGNPLQDAPRPEPLERFGRHSHAERGNDETAGYDASHACLTTDWILAGFADPKNGAQRRYREFVQAGKGQPSPWQRLKNQIYLGDDDFIKDMQSKLDPERSLKDIPKKQKQAAIKPLSYFAERYKTPNESMAHAYLSGHYTLAQVGEYYGVSYATVSRAVKQTEQGR